MPNPAENMKARETRAFIVWDINRGKQIEIKKQPRMDGARSSGVTGSSWPRFAPVFTSATGV